MLLKLKFKEPEDFRIFQKKIEKHILIQLKPKPKTVLGKYMLEDGKFFAIYVEYTLYMDGTNSFLKQYLYNYYNGIFKILRNTDILPKLIQ